MEARYASAFKSKNIFKANGVYHSSEQPRNYWYASRLAEFMQSRTWILQVAEIGKHAIIGVLFGGRCVSRYGHVTWVVISTEHKIFHVDIIGLTKQTPLVWDLLESEIFSNKRLLKVIHDCRHVADYLSHHQNIILKNVFDTQVSLIQEFVY